MKVNIKTNWHEIILLQTKKEYWSVLSTFVESEYLTKIIFPTKDKIFSCFNFFDIEKTKVVIFGQDPYHNPDQANGLAFSVNDKCKIPPSLQNIFSELKNDIGVNRTNPDLSDWAQQGVLLINNCLTVELNHPNSHSKSGWNIFTNNIVIELQKRTKNIVFVLWGNNAADKATIIDTKNNLIIKSTHPSPFSAHKGFFGSKPFSATNDYLVKCGKKPIVW